MNKVTLKRIGAGAVSIALLSAAGLVAWRHAHPPPSSFSAASTVAPATGPAPRFLWPKGTRYLYSLSWTGDSSGNLLPTAGARAGGGEPVAFGSTIESDVALRSFGTRGDAFVLGVSLQNIRSFQVRAGGRAEPADLAAVRRAMEGPEARVAIDARGVVREISFPADMSASLRTTLQALVEMMQVTLPEVASSGWDAKELDPSGDASVHYELDPASGGPTLRRTRTGYTSLVSIPSEALTGAQSMRGSDTIVLDGHGTVASIERADGVSYQRHGETKPAMSSSGTFSLDRKEVSTFDADEAVAAQEPHALGEPQPEPDRAGRIDSQLSHGVSLETIMMGVNGFDNGGRLPKNFTTRGGAYLRLHPEACDSLAAKFGDPALSVKGKGLLLDVLTTAGSKPAQQAMRTALASDAAKRNPGDYAVLVQRFSFVRGPDAASAKFVERTLEQSTGVARQGAAAALGSIVRSLGKDDRALAAACDQKLRDGLKSATTPEDKQGFLLGLGNGRTPEDQDAIRGLAADPTASVRAQVASSLNWFDTSDARATLLGLASDADPVVAREAFSSLQSQSLGSDEWTALVNLGNAGGIPSTLDSALLALVTSQLGNAGAQGTALLQRIAQQENGRGEVAARAQQLLALASNGSP